MSTAAFADAFMAAVKYAAEHGRHQGDALVEAAREGQRRGDYLPTKVLADYLEENPHLLATARPAEQPHSILHAIGWHLGRVYVTQPDSVSGFYTTSAAEMGTDHEHATKGMRLSVRPMPGGGLVTLAAGGSTHNFSFPSSRSAQHAASFSQRSGGRADRIDREPSPELVELLQRHHEQPDTAWLPLLQKLAAELPEHFKTPAELFIAARHGSKKRRY